MAKRFISGIVCFALAILASNAHSKSFAEKLVEAAQERTNHFVIYNGAYRSIEYPWGDVPKHFGVCTDVIIRSYRALGFDLQQLVHEDMRANFSLYPGNWGLSRPDTNIDHRRVPNLRAFFSRFGVSLGISNEAEDYLPGDIVTWMLEGNAPHIGIVSSKKSADGRPYVIHNIGWGPKEEDRLFAYQVTGHYRYEPQ